MVERLPLSKPELRCAGCAKRPDELTCYTVYLQDSVFVSADDYVWSEEGTLNFDTGLFLCDGCYIAAGQPSAPGGWVVPDPYS